MGTWIIPILIISLICTILFEVIFAFIWGVNEKKDFLLVCLVNVLTNPVVVLCYYLVLLHTNWNVFFIKFLLEFFAIIVECFCYKFLSKNINHPFLFSFLNNAVSFSLGLIINAFL